MIVAGGDYGAYVSTNSGAKWTNVSIQDYGGSVASSADGNSLLVCGASLHLSTNFGMTWASLTNAPGYMSFFCPSADGTKIVGASSSPSVYTSTNSGISWVTNMLPASAKAIASSADGCRWILAESSKIYISTNSGLSWFTNMVTPPFPASWISVASSADGSKLAAVGNYPYASGFIYVSTNGGANWTSNGTPGLYWQSVASSADGSTLLTAAPAQSFSGAVIFVSTDFGMNWVSNSILTPSYINNPMSVNATADGNLDCRCSTTPTHGSLQKNPSPHLNLNFSGVNLALSWIIPSTNFALQQSPDLGSWTMLTNQPTLNFTNLQNEIMLLSSNNSSFFRLISQ